MGHHRWALALEAIYVGGANSGADAWSACREMLEATNVLEPRYAVVGRSVPVPVEQVMRIVAGKPAGVFSVSGEATQVHYGPTRHKAMALVVLFRASPVARVLDEWATRLSNSRGFMYARVFDVEYDRWQNEAVLDTYETLGRDATGLPRVWDPVFEEYRVDISKNPGRRVGRDGYSEATGHVMWLGEAFWRLTGSSRLEVKRRLSCKKMDGLLRVQLSTRPFTEANPPDESTRALLFPGCGAPEVDPADLTP